MNEDDKEDLISFINKYDNIFIQPNLIKKFNEIIIYLQNQSNNNIENKIIILDFFLKLNFPIYFNIEIIYNICKDLNVNLYKLLIDEYFLSNNEIYCKKIINLLSKLINSKNCVYEIYEYYQQFILKYIYNNNDTNEKITSEYLNKYLELGRVFFTFNESIEPNNYLYFSDFENTSQLLIYNNKLLDFKEGLNILLFFNLIIKPIEIKKYFNNKFKEFVLIEISLNSQEKITLSINEKSELIASFFKDSLFYPFLLNEFTNLLIKFKEINNKIKVELYINENKVNFHQIEINYSEIVQIILFKNFIGTVSNIILYKNDANNNEEGFPSIFLKNNKILIPFGIYNEYLFFNFINEDLINEKNKFIFEDNMQLFSQEKDSNKIFNFYKNLIAIYLPNRIKKNKNDFILLDSINNIRILFNIEEKLNGIYLSEFNSNNLNIFGGFNIFVPIFEFMIKCEDILTEQIIQNFFQIIIENLEINNGNNLNNLINKNFWFVLSLFLEKFPEKYNNNFLVSLINIISNKIHILKDYYGEKNVKINLLNNEFNNIILNSNIFFNYDYNNQQIIIKQFIKNNEKNINYFSIDENQIIKILLNYDKEKNIKFCCKKHANYFNNSTSNEILEPELNNRLNYLNKLFDYFRKNKKIEIFFSIFNLLSKNLSPCLQLFIIENFINFLNKFDYSIDIKNESINLIKICFFVLKVCLFDVKIKIIDLIIKIYKKYSDFTFTEEPKKFLFNIILPKHFIFNLFDFKNCNNNLMLNNNDKIKNINFTEKEISIYKNFKENNYFYEMIDNLIILLINGINFNEKFYFLSDCVVKIISYLDLNHIHKFFNEQIKIFNQNVLNYLNDNLFFFQFLLDTSFLTFINIENKEIKFPLNNFEEIKEEEKNKIFDNINIKTFEYILLFIKNNVYLLDFFLIWAKYYYSIFKNDKNNNKILSKFIDKIFKLIISELKFNLNDNSNELNKYFYINNIYFEYLFYLKFEEENENNININLKINKFSLKINENFESNFSEEKIEINLINNVLKIIKYYDFIDNLIKNKEEKELYFTKQKTLLINYINYFFYDFNDSNLISVNNGINLFIITFFNLFSILQMIKDYGTINNLIEKIINLIIFSFDLCLNLKQINENLYTKYNKQIDDISSSIFFIIMNDLNKKKMLNKFEDLNLKKIYFKHFGKLIKYIFNIFFNLKENEEKNKKKPQFFLFIMIKDLIQLDLNNQIDYDKLKNLFIKEENEENLIKITENFFNENLIIYFQNRELIDKSKKLLFFNMLEMHYKRNKSIYNIIPFYNLNDIFNISLDKKICLIPYFLKNVELYEKNKRKFIKNMNKKIDFNLNLFDFKNKFENRLKEKKYKKIKKKLFRFNNFLSNKNYYYNEILKPKFKLLNYNTKDFSQIFMVPINNFSEYLPEFKYYNKEEMFYSNELEKNYNKNLIDFSLNKNNLTETKNNNEINTIQPSNFLYDLSLENFDFLNTKKNINENEKKIDDLMNYIKKYVLDNNESQLKFILFCCLVKNMCHIKGLFYINNNNDKITFVAIDYKKNKFNEDYDDENDICFGSNFKNVNKYKNYILNIKIKNIEFILKRRYIYRKNSIEIFTNKKKSYFFKFKNKEECDLIYDKIYKSNKNIFEHIYLNNSLTSIYKENNKIGISNKNLIKKIYISELYKNWQNYELSTFNLIMYLNIFSNRSYNDLNQYPVFPWIITDFSSEKIDLDNFFNDSNKATILRALDTPIGMLCHNSISSERKNEFLNGWDMIEKDDIDYENKGRYTSHYSTEFYVSYYLVRIFPYSIIHIEIQGKNFDSPNRLFSDLYKTFQLNISLKNDVCEIIPEFFVFPEMFYNLNNLNLGFMKEENIHINNVGLPKWCSNDGYKFVYIFRTILESLVLGYKINKWFDLIFGSKQSGKEAELIHNLFIRQSYEKFEEEFDKADLKNKKILSKMIEFGVTPNKIFNYDCYERNKIDINKFDLLLRKNVIFSKYKIFIKNDKILKMQTLNSGNKIDIFFINNEFIYNYSFDYKKLEKIKNNEINNELNKILNDILNYKKTDSIKNLKCQFNENDNINPYFLFKNIDYLITGNFWCGKIFIQKIEKKKNKENIIYNFFGDVDNSLVNKIIVDENENYIIYSNLKGFIKIATISKKDKIIINEYKILYEHKNEIIDMFLSEQLNLFIACDKDNYCNLFSFPKFNLLNSYKLKENNIKNIFLSDSPLPSIILFSDDNKLISYSINFHLLNIKIYEKKIINNVKIFKNKYLFDFIIFSTKSDKFNCIEILSLPYFEEIKTININKNKKIIDYSLINDNNRLIIIANDKELKKNCLYIINTFI